MARWDQRAQMHVLEVMLTAVLFTSAMNVVIAVLPSANQDDSGAIQLQLLGRDVLEVADGMVPENATVAARFANSTLKWWLLDAGTANLSAYLNATLLPAMAYHLEFVKGEQELVTLDHSIPLGEVVVVERMLSHQGEVHLVQLSLWYGPRGGGP